MENFEKDIIEKIKTIQIKNLFQAGVYIDIHINNYWFQGIIKDIKSNNKYDIIYLFKDDQFKRKPETLLSSLSIIGENTTSPDNIIRKRCLDNDLFQLDNKDLLDLLKQKIQEFDIDLNSNEIHDKDDENEEQKENNSINYKGYNLYQFLAGIFIDSLAFIYNEVEPGKKNTKSLNNIILLCLDIVIFILEQIKSNLPKIKFFINNKRSLIFENIYAIFASFQIIFANIKPIFAEDFFSTDLITEKKNKNNKRMLSISSK